MFFDFHTLKRDCPLLQLVSGLLNLSVDWFVNTQLTWGAEDISSGLRLLISMIFLQKCNLKNGSRLRTRGSIRSRQIKSIKIHLTLLYWNLTDNPLKITHILKSALMQSKCDLISDEDTTGPPAVSVSGVCGMSYLQLLWVVLDAIPPMGVDIKEKWNVRKLLKRDVFAHHLFKHLPTSVVDRVMPRWCK